MRGLGRQNINKSLVIKQKSPPTIKKQQNGAPSLTPGPNDRATWPATFDCFRLTGSGKKKRAQLIRNVVRSYKNHPDLHNCRKHIWEKRALIVTINFLLPRIRMTLELNCWMYFGAHMRCSVYPLSGNSLAGMRANEPWNFKTLTSFANWSWEDRLLGVLLCQLQSIQRSRKLKMQYWVFDRQNVFSSVRNILVLMTTITFKRVVLFFINSWL